MEHKNFKRIAYIVLDLTFLVIVLTFALLSICLISFFVWIIKSDNYLIAKYNWILITHSLFTLWFQLGLRKDIDRDYKQFQRQSKSDDNEERDNSLEKIKFLAFVGLIVTEFVMISQTILVYYPLRGK